MMAFAPSRLAWFAVTCIAAAGCATTSWVRKTPQEDNQFKYYVGRSYNAAGASEGLSVARDDAKLRAIEENFGAKYKFQRDTHENIDAAQVTDRLRAISRVVHLEDFKELEVHQEEVDDDRFNTSVLYRYPKHKIAEEKKRLTNQKDTDEDFHFDPVDTTPAKRNSGSVDHHVVQSTYVFGIGGSAWSASMNQADNSSGAFAAFAEMRLSRYVALNAYGSFGGKTDNYSNGALSITADSFGIGFPIYFSSADKSAWSMFFMPALQASYSDFSFKLAPLAPPPLRYQSGSSVRRAH